MFKPLFVTLASVLFAAVFTRFTGAAPATNLAVKPATAKMAALLERLARQVKPMENPYFSVERAAILRAKVAGMPLTEESIHFHYLLGQELMNAGENAAGLQEFRWVEKMDLAAKPANRINTLLNEALCYVRMGELQNCLSNHNSESCLLPFRPGGLHIWPEGSRSAIGVLTNLLGEAPNSLAARWLLNIAAMTVGDYPDKVPARWLVPPKVFESDYDIKRFPEVAGPAGLADNQRAGASVVEDFDGDGLLDVMVTSIGVRDQMRLFHNNGDGTFTDRAAEAGLIGLTGGLNAVSTDYNNDGWPDVFILRGAWQREEGRFPKSLLKNCGDGTFEDVTESAGLMSPHPSQTAVWLDFDGDGWLDLFIGNETTPGQRPHTCELYHNNRDGTFTEMAAKAGIAVRAYVKGVAAGDYNNDGRPDLYLSILAGNNLLFRNDGPPLPGGDANAGWKFTELGAAAGVQKPYYSFPTWFFDFDNDGWEDLFVSGYHITDVGDIAADYLGLPTGGEKAKLYHNRGDGTFEDVTQKYGLDHVLHTMGSNYGDLDNDGWLDFYLGTGDPDLLTLVPNRMFRNDAGRKFQDVTSSGGFGHLQKGHGVSFADLDNDGDQDVHEDMGGAVSSDRYPNVLYANPGHGNHWLKLRLAGVKANRPGMGARLKIVLRQTTGEQRIIYRTVSTGGSFGTNPFRQEIGLGDAEAIKSVEISWPGSGTVQTLAGFKLDQCYRVTETNNVPELVPLKTFALPQPDAHAMHHH